MNLKDLRNKVVRLYKSGATMEEIKQKTGIDFSQDTIQKWIKEDEYNSYKENIIKLQNRQKKEQDREKRKQILLELRQKLEEILKIVPDDTDMQIKLMYTNINLKDSDRAREIGEMLLKKTNSIEVLNGISIIEEQMGNYDKALERIEQILEKNPNNEFYKSKKERLQKTRERHKRSKFKKTEGDRKEWIEKIQKEFIYGNISLGDISKIIEQARKYPNYVKSLIFLLDIKADITEDFQGEIEELNGYLGTEDFSSEEDYKEISDAITRIKSQIEQKKIIDNYYDSRKNSGEDR